jgi:hypothetical protein
MDDNILSVKALDYGGMAMHKKTLFIGLGILTSASLLAALLLILSGTCVKADPLRVPQNELRSERVQRPTFRDVTIAQPTTGDSLTTTHQPIYPVEIEVVGVPEVVSVTVDGGATYQEATKHTVGRYTYDWGLPEEDYQEHLLIAQARYPAPAAETIASDPVTAYVDTIPPQGAVIAVPPQVETTGFTVSWSATDGSGVVTYDVQYQREGQSSWTSWVSRSTETSRVFTETLEEPSCTFRMRARDKGNNRSGWVAGTVQVGGFKVYLPLALDQWSWWYQHDHYEPNDTPSQAWGPLEPDTLYDDAYIWNDMDRDDYYYFDCPALTNVQITLTHIPEGTDYDLYVYYYDSGDDAYVQKAGSNNPGRADEQVTFYSMLSRRYYVRVYPYAGSSHQPYRLKLTYPAGD